MENQYQSLSKVLPGNVVGSFKDLFKGKNGINTNCAIAKRVDCASFEIGYVPENIPLNPIIGGGELIYGLSNLEKRLRGTIATGNPSVITIERDPAVELYTVYLK